MPVRFPRRLALAAPLAALLMGAADPTVLLGRPAPRGAPKLERERLADPARPPSPLYLVIDTPYEIGSGLVTYVHVTAYRGDFGAAPGARVYAGDTLVGTTDPGGSLVFRHTPRPASGEGSGDALVLVTAVYEPTGPKGPRHVGQVSFASYRRTDTFERAQLFVHTDRGVYQPGDTVHVRAIAWRLLGEYEPIAAGRVELHLTGDDGRLLGGGAFATSDWGTGSFDLPLPDAMPEGSYTLAAVFEGARGEARLRVQRYVPPALRLEHDLKRYLATSATSLPFTVQVSSLGGAPLAAGSLEVRVEHGGETFFSARAALGGAASFPFEVDGATLRRLIARAGEGATFDVVLTATDAAGRKDTVVRDVLLAQNPFTCILESDKDAYVPGDVARVQVKLTDLDDAPVRGRRVRLVPAAGREPPAALTDAAGIALFQVPMPQEPLRLQAFLEGVAEALGEVVLQPSGQKGMSSTVAVPVVLAGQKVPIEVRLAAGYEPVEKRVHGDVVDSSGALVAAFTLPLERGASGWAARGAFTAPSWGTMLLTLYCAARSGLGEPSSSTVGLLTEGQQITVTPTARLRLTLAGLPATARPGQKLRLTAQVSDPGGRPRAAAIGASVVDTGVLSLLDPLEVKPEERFYNPENKVLASTGAKILTWPVVSRNWGDTRQDIALPPFDFQPPASGEEPAPYYEDLGDDAVGEGAGSLSGIGTGGGGMGMGVGLGSVGRAGAGAGVAAAAPERVTVTVRTRFADTSLWIPDGVAEGGRFAFELTVPDALTRQTVTLIASDERGGVATLRQEVAVRQELSARSDFPAVLRLGEPVEVQAAVQNLGAQKVAATLILLSNNLLLEGAASRELEVPPASVVGARFRVKPTSLGEVSYELRARGGGADDTERRTVRVVPAGVPVIETVGGNAGRGAPYELELRPDATTAVLAHVQLPGSGRVVREYLELLGRGPERSAGFWEMPGTQAALSYRVAMFLDAQGALTTEAALRIRDAIAEDLVRIGISDDGAGGARFLRTGAVSPYLTGRALEGLTAARAADFPVAPQELQARARVILAAADPAGQVAIDDIAWWEGGGTDRKVALTAQLFRILAEAGPDAIPEEHRAGFERMRGQAEIVPSLTDDPMAIANAGLGLLAYAAQHQKTTLEPKLARRLLRRVMESYRGGHWEPSWFNASGGRLEATAAAAELVRLLDPEGSTALVREVSDALLASREALGAWHDTSGAIALVRALAALPPAPAEPQPYRVSVELDGKRVAEAAIDPEDPFAGALQLATVDLTPHLTPDPARPARRLTVTTTGLSPVRVTVEHRRWKPEARAGTPSVKRTLSATTVQPGTAVKVTLALDAAKPLRRLALEESIPAQTTVDRPSLDALVKRGTLSGYHLAGPRLLLYLPSLSGKATVTYSLLADRPGTTTLGPVLLRPLDRPEDAAVVGNSAVLQVQ